MPKIRTLFCLIDIKKSVHLKVINSASGLQGETGLLANSWHGIAMHDLLLNRGLQGKIGLLVHSLYGLLCMTTAAKMLDSGLQGKI